jgi:SNF2 family DNA or RNA helicase
MHAFEQLSDSQWAAIEFILSGEDALLAADVGTGKTVISATAAKYKLEANLVTRWLILAPLLVATDTWATEFQQWEHLRDLDVAIACGNEQQRIDALNSPAEIVVINYENLPWLLKQYPPHPHNHTIPFDGLICDEIDKLKSVSSNRFKDFRNRIKWFQSRIGLTGTLLPNDLTEIWGQVYMVDGGQNFGRSFYAWRKKWFYPTDYNQYNWAPFAHTRQAILDQITGLVYRLKAENVPDVIVDPPYKLILPDEIKRIYRELENKFITKLNSGDIVDAVSAGVLSGKLQQIAAGFSYVGDNKSAAVWHDYEKFEWLERLRNDLAGKQLVVFYHFVEELQELKRRYPGLKYLGGGVSNKQARDAIARWNSGQLPMLALHPASAGHGLNLQKSGAHHIAFLTIPWSGGMYKQVVGRLARRGNASPRVYVHTAVYANTIDEHVLTTVTGKLNEMESFLDAIKHCAA